MNGIADGTMVSYLQSVNYTCNTGYRMNGSATARCSADGTLQMPTCNSKCLTAMKYEVEFCMMTVGSSMAGKNAPR